MERLYDIGKRFERLLYISIIVMVSSFLLKSLFIALSTQSSLEQLAAYKNLEVQLVNKEKKINSLSMDIDSVNNSVYFMLDFYKKMNRLVAKGNNSSDKSKGDLENEYFKIYKESINSLRRDIGLDNANNINDTKYFIYDLFRKELSDLDLDFNTNQIIESSIPEKDKILKYNDIIKWIDSKIDEGNNHKIQIMNIESTLNIPFKIGDMTSGISLISIANTASYIMPFFMVIWIGSLSMTRSFEIINLMKVKDISMAYPHIFNIYPVDKEDKNSLDIYVLGDDKKRKVINITNNIFKIVKSTIIIFITLIILIPFYYGDYFYILNNQGSSVIQLIILSFCISVNLVQISVMLNNEWSSSDTIYGIYNGLVHEYKVK